MNQSSKYRSASIVAGLVLLCAAATAQISPDPVSPVPVSQGSISQGPVSQGPVSQTSDFPVSAAPVAVRVDTASAQTPTDPSGAAPATLTFQDALKLARTNSPTYRSAVTDSGVAHEDKVQSRAGLLPNVNFNSQAIYTQPRAGALPTDPRFIAGNGVHEYIAQGNVHEALSLEGLGGFRHAQAAEAVARARAEIAARGLVLTVVQNYYGFVVAQRKYATAQKLADEGQQFLILSRKLENGGEVAHSDVIKAQLQFNQQSRDLQESRLAMDRARLDLAVLVFPNFNQNFSVVDDLQSLEPLPSLEEVRAAAGHKNPDLRAALASLDVAKGDVASAWGAMLPSLSLDYFYGIDATHFATRGTAFDSLGNPIRVDNLGHSASATLQFPIFSWGAGVSKVKQANLHRTQAQVELSFTQRQLLANLQTFYNEARASQDEQESLRQSAELAADSLRLTTLRYQAGEATVLEVVDAQNTLALSRNAYDDGQARYRGALANLQTLTGTL
jgi:outer membrane protein TolC